MEDDMEMSGGEEDEDAPIKVVKNYKRQVRHAIGPLIWAEVRVDSDWNQKGVSLCMCSVP
jgi:hypothetical protein